jgi:hypothetical protein
MAILKEYDAGLLNDFGGGDIEWWQDYIRSELGRAYEYYYSQLDISHCEAGPNFCLICLKEFKKQVMTVDELKDLWNSQTDHTNQWDELGLDEIVAFAQTKK